VKARYGYSLTFLPFFTRAAIEALRAFPIVNASVEGPNIIYHNEINIGIAVALGQRLDRSGYSACRRTERARPAARHRGPGGALPLAAN